MKPYNSGDCIGRDEEEYNNIFLGRSNRYNSFDLDYETNIKPYLIKCRMEMILDKLEDCYLLDLNHVCSIIAEFFKPLLEQALDFELPVDAFLLDKALEDKKFAKKILNDYSSYGGFTGWFAGLLTGKMEYVVEGSLIDLCVKAKNESCDVFENEESHKNLISTLILFRFLDGNVRYKDNIPGSMYKLVEKFANISINLISRIYDYSTPSKEFIWSGHYLEEVSEDVAYKVAKTPGARVARDMLILNGFEFKTKNDAETLRRLMNFEDKSLLLGVCFQDCNFNGNDCTFTEVFGDLLFQSCNFEKKTKITLVLDGKIEFDNCNFYNLLDLSRLQMDESSNIKIFSSIFHKGSKLDMSEIHFGSTGFKGINITNTQFIGDCDVSGIKEPIIFNLKNDFFMGELKTSQTKFDDCSIIENIGFPTQHSTQSDKSRKELYETLKASNLENKAKELDILPQEGSKKSGKLDMDAYQAAYATGFLNPDFAAFCIGRSKIFLAKKRQADRKKLSQQSIPFIISGKDIQYPVEVLLAFKSKNWDKLKEFREKYPIPKDAD